jgi:hypothetical protein
MRVEGHAPCVVYTAQVPLMAEVPRARAALDAHVGVAGVAEQGLWFLRNLAVVEANKVRRLIKSVRRVMLVLPCVS